MKVLVIDAKTWPNDTNANLWCLKHDVGQLMNKSIDYKKIIWKKIEMELNNINVKNLGFDYSIYSEVLNIKSESFINIPESFCDCYVFFYSAKV